jgi:hypothetical protein
VDPSARAAFSVATGSAFGASNLATPTGCSLWREHLRAGERWEFRRGLEAWSSPAFSVTALFELEAQCGVHGLLLRTLHVPAVMTRLGVVRKPPAAVPTG